MFLVTKPGFSHRIEVLLPPVVSAPVFSILRHTDVVVGLDHFDWSDSDNLALIVRSFSAQRRNMIVAGATGSGKNHLCQCMPCRSCRIPDR